MAKLARTRTHVGRPRGAGARRARGFRKSRYAPNKKKKFMAKRAPFTESKTRTGEEIYAMSNIVAPIGEPIINPIEFAGWSAENYALLPTRSLNSHQQGLGESQMIGQSVFAKYLKMKITFKWPQGADLAMVRAPRTFLIHGFIKTSPNEKDGLTALPNWGHVQDDYWLKNEIKRYIDEREDRLRYIPKQNSTMKILGYKQVSPSQTRGAQQPVTAFDNVGDDTTIGCFPDSHRSVYWPMMRKVHYERGRLNTWTTNADGSLGTNYNYFININQWRPFCVVYSPEYDDDTVVSANLPSIAYNDILYYSDS